MRCSMFFFNILFNKKERTQQTQFSKENYYEEQFFCNSIVLLKVAIYFYCVYTKKGKEMCNSLCIF